MKIPQKTVRRALAAYEALPPLSGREARMRAAIEAIARKTPPMAVVSVSGTVPVPETPPTVAEAIDRWEARKEAARGSD